MLFRVKVSARAEQDLIDIWLPIAEHSSVNADRFLDLLNARIDSLVEFPDRGAARPGISKDARILIEGNYLVFYRKQHSRIEIIRVLHGAMDLTGIELD